MMRDGVPHPPTPPLLCGSCLSARVPVHPGLAPLLQSMLAGMLLRWFTGRGLVLLSPGNKDAVRFSGGGKKRKRPCAEIPKWCRLIRSPHYGAPRSPGVAVGRKTPLQTKLSAPSR